MLYRWWPLHGGRLVLDTEQIKTGEKCRSSIEQGFATTRGASSLTDVRQTPPIESGNAYVYFRNDN